MIGCRYLGSMDPLKLYLGRPNNSKLFSCPRTWAERSMNTEIQTTSSTIWISSKIVSFEQTRRSRSIPFITFIHYFLLHQSSWSTYPTYPKEFGDRDPCPCLIYNELIYIYIYTWLACGHIGTRVG